ncbi:MAG: CoA transferase [Chloroflexota bacterium]|nr:MAG: CoA transferase [Chloroflexota bacterium]
MGREGVAMVDVRERTPERAGGETGGPGPALKGLRVIELANGVAGPYCGKMLADFGADVIKVELPQGDPSRAVGPFPEGDRDAGASFLWLNTNKRGLVLDWLQPAGRKVLRQLVAQADVLVESGPGAELSRLRLDPKSLLRLSSRLIVTSVTPFGRTGPWRDRPATDLTVSALGGMSFLNGLPGEEPLREPGSQTEIIAGISAYIGTMAALADRSVTGQGQAVDAGALEAMLGILTPYITQYSYQGSYMERGPQSRKYMFRCQDGYVSIVIALFNAWELLTEFLDLGEKASAPDEATNMMLMRDDRRVHELLEPGLQRYTRTELFAALMESRMNVGMVLSIPELRTDQHLAARRFFKSVDDPRAREAVFPGAPFRLEDCEWTLRRPAPGLGEHSEEVLAELMGCSTRRRVALRRAGITGGKG